MSLRRFRVTSLLFGLTSLTSAQNLTDYFVDGRTGQDIPGNGLSAAAPWKTITYAIAQIPPVANPANWNTLYVEGNQAYSPSTNGETLPITPSFNLWIEGTFAGHGVQPVIRANPGGTAMAFSPTVTYSRNPSTIRYLVFEGGAYGMTMGNSTNQRHRPRIQDCTFRGQSVAGARVVNADNSRGIDPRFFQTLFTAAPRGIEVVAAVAGAVVYPDVEECTFDGLTDAAIYLDDTSNGGNVGGTFRSNWFRACNRGVHVRSGPAAMTTNFTVYSCSFVDIANEGVRLEIVRPGDPAATVESSTFLRCGVGVRFAGTLNPGPYALTAIGNAMHDCGTGIDINVTGTGSCAVQLRDNFVRRCGTGASVSVGAASVQFLLRSQRDRLLDNDSGLAFFGLGAASSATLESGMVCGNRTQGLAIAGTTPFIGRSLTIADNALGVAAGSGTAGFDHCVFANVQDVSGTPAITYSCLANSTYAGTGNLNRTDPRLLRPLYKLAPNSPCIDAGNIALPLPATDYEGDPRASVSRPNGPQLPDLGADEYAQLGSARKFGTRGFGYYNFFPQISSPSPRVVIGGSLVIDLTDAILPVFNVPARDAFLTFGLRDDSGALPPDLGAIGAPSSWLWNELFAVLGLFPVTPLGTASVTVPVPGDAVLVGQTFTFQWFANLRSANPRAPVASDGLRVTIGQ